MWVGSARGASVNNDSDPFLAVYRGPTFLGGVGRRFASGDRIAFTDEGRNGVPERRIFERTLRDLGKLGSLFARHIAERSQAPFAVTGQS